jgi:CRP-like cAMP-binding protein
MGAAQQVAQAGDNEFIAGGDEMRNVDDPKVRRLGEVALFQHCTPKELTRLAGITDQAVLETGQVLCRQGEVATAAFVIDDGDASVKVGEYVIGARRFESVLEDTPTLARNLLRELTGRIRGLDQARADEAAA